MELLMAVATDFSVMEFFEKSPRRRLKSLEFRVSVRSAASAKEPVSVECRKMKFGRGGSLSFNESGRTVRISLTG